MGHRMAQMKGWQIDKLLGMRLDRPQLRFELGEYRFSLSFGLSSSLSFSSD